MHQQLDNLQALLTKPPASLAWATKEGRAIGASEGFLVDLWPDRVEVACLMPPDRLDLVERNGNLLLLILMAMRPTWKNVVTWMADQYRAAKRFRPTEAHPYFELTNTEHRVRFTWDAKVSRVTLRVAV